MKVLGADIGFGYTKATDGRQFQVFKSVVGEAAEIQFTDVLLPGAAQHPRHIEHGGQAYFVGDDPYDGLKRALKAEIDETAWEELNSTVSRPFPKPEKGSICVKVINHFGDEVQKVFRV